MIVYRTIQKLDIVGEAFRLPRDGEPVPYSLYDKF